MRERVLVTGGGGFVGRNAALALEAAGYAVVAPRRDELDLRERTAVERILVEERIDVVVHAAGRVGGIAANIADPVAFYADNVLIGTAVVLGADAAGVGRLVNLSSSCAYPRDRELLSEDDLLTGALEPTNEGYAIAKIGTDRLCEWVAARGGASRRYRTLVPCNLYGPHDHFAGERAHLVAAALAKTIAAHERGDETIEIWGDGLARREFMHVHDLCGALLHVLPQLHRLPPRLNVGAGRDATVLEHYRAAALAVGWHGAYEHDLARPVGMRRKLLDVRRAAALGWHAEIGLVDGIRDTYEWLLRERRRPEEIAA